MKRALAILTLAGLAIAAAILLRQPAGSTERKLTRGSTISLASSLEPLREAFNAARDRPRALALLSPSCPVCWNGALALSAALEEQPRAVALMVWTPGLPWDVRQKVGKRVERFAGRERALQFHDSRRLGAAAVAGVLDWPEPAAAWDVYLLYEPGVEWTDSLPPPDRWLHQRRGVEEKHWVDEEELGAELLAGLAAF